MPVASRETLGHLHGLVTDCLLDYVTNTAPNKRRASWLSLIRRLLVQSGFRHIEDAPKGGKRLLDKLYKAYVAGLIEQVNSGTAKPGVIAEVGLFLRSQSVNADSIQESRRTNKTQGHAPVLSVVPNQSLPFNSQGTRLPKAP